MALKTSNEGIAGSGMVISVHAIYLIEGGAHRSYVPNK